MCKDANWSRIDSRQKVKYIKNFLRDLKAHEDTAPFFTLNTRETGFLDFQFITKKHTTIQDVEKGLKDAKYSNVHQLSNELRSILSAVSDYLLIDDPLQHQISDNQLKIQEFEHQFAEDFREERVIKADLKSTRKQQKIREKKKERQREKEREEDKDKDSLQTRKSTFAQKLEMFYLLRTHEENEEYIRSVGESYGIANETETEYSIKLDYNATSPWLELIEKKTE